MIRSPLLSGPYEPWNGRLSKVVVLFPHAHVLCYRPREDLVERSELMERSERKVLCLIDVLIKNGTVVDGVGTSRYHADVAVSDGKIVAIGKITDGAKKVIDAAI